MSVQIESCGAYMKIRKSESWQWETTGTETTSRLFGLNIFAEEFQPTGEYVEYKSHSYDIYTVLLDGEEKRFAMTEISYGVYDFLLYKY